MLIHFHSIVFFCNKHLGKNIEYIVKPVTTYINILSIKHKNLLKMMDVVTAVK